MQDPSRPETGSAGTRVRVRPGLGGADSRLRRRRMVTWALLGGAAVLLVNAIVGENGYLATMRARRTEATLTRAIASVRIENRRLQDERHRLDNDPATLEDTIRGELGYIRPGETVVVVSDTPPVPATPPR
jgi:cell division protein FtsB